MGKYFIKIGKIRAKIHEIGKIKAIFGLGMTPIYGLKNGQIKSLMLEPFGEVGGDVPEYFSSRTHFAKIEDKKVTVKN